MAKALRAVGKIAGVVATVASFIPGGQAIAAAAAAVSAVANTGAQLLAKKPPVRGAVNNVLVASEGPMACIIGRSYYGGQLTYDRGYGPTIDDVPNPYRFLVASYGIGPAESIENILIDFAPISFSGTAATGFYAGFLYASKQLGAQPESAALAPQWSGAPDWGSTSKLSGKIAVGLSAKWDKKGKKWPNGLGQPGIVGVQRKAYDPRLDSTQPGGSGSCRANDESTWVNDANAALQAGTYILGRRQNGMHVFGIGDTVDAIDVPTLMAWANVCEVNGWEANGVLIESGQPGERWANLKRLCAAGGCEPIQLGTGYSFRYQAPRVALDTITKDDYADAEISYDAVTWSRERPNGLIPKIRSESHKWELTAGTLIQYADYVTDDGQSITQEAVWEMVTDSGQGAELTAYRLLDQRELGPFDLPLKWRMRSYAPGSLLVWNDPELGIDNITVEVLRRSIDVVARRVTLTVQSKTDGKDDFALGKTTTLPPAPTLTPPSDVATVVGGAIDAGNAAPVIDASMPATGIEGQSWYDSNDDNRHYIYTGGAWVAVTADAVTPPAVRTTLGITARTQVTAAITRTLDPGESLLCEADIRVTLTGNSTQTITIQWREAGGTYATLGSDSDSGTTGDVVYPQALATLTNSGATRKVYEVRAVCSYTGTATATVDATASFFRA